MNSLPRSEPPSGGPPPGATAGGGKRPYRSALRREQAEHTKIGICLAAAPLFAEHGYARTSVREIAAAAGVAVETIYALGDKPEVFLQAFELSLRGDLRGTPLLELESVAPAADVSTLRDFLRIVTDFVVGSNRRSVRLWAAFVEGANSNARLAEGYADFMTQMRGQGERVLAFAVQRGLCAQPYEPRYTLDVIWATLHPSQYDLLVTHAGWQHERYQAWLITAIESILSRASQQLANP